MDYAEGSDRSGHLPYDVVELLPILPNLQPRRSGAWKAAADGYPNPWRDPGACGMSSRSSICDPEKILSEAWRDRIASRLRNLDVEEDGGVDFKKCRESAFRKKWIGFQEEVVGIQVAAAIVGRVE